MTITQTVEIPANRRNITLEIPSEIPAGRTIIAFTPAPEAENPRYNAKAMAAITEAEAMIKSEIPAKWHKPHELKEVWKDILEN